MIVYGNPFEWCVAMRTDNGRMLVIGVFATRDAAKLFMTAAFEDAPQYEFELITLDDYERDYCEPINGKDFKEASRA